MRDDEHIRSRTERAVKNIIGKRCDHGADIGSATTASAVACRADDRSYGAFGRSPSAWSSEIWTNPVEVPGAELVITRRTCVVEILSNAIVVG